MGSHVAFENGLKLKARAPLPVTWKLLRHGKVFREQKGHAFEMPVHESGVYRIEAWLDVAGEAMIWILSNPIYVRAA
jgi:hypothetical protein